VLYTEHGSYNPSRTGTAAINNAGKTLVHHGQQFGIYGETAGGVFKHANERTEPRIFKKKGHKQQYKRNEQVKSAVNEVKEAVVVGKNEACITKLNEGIELIDQRQKRILIADKSDYGWKTVGEYLDNKFADDDQDAKKMKKAEKEA